MIKYFLLLLLLSCSYHVHRNGLTDVECYAQHVSECMDCQQKGMAYTPCSIQCRPVTDINDRCPFWTNESDCSTVLEYCEAE